MLGDVCRGVSSVVPLTCEVVTRHNRMGASAKRTILLVPYRFISIA